MNLVGKFTNEELQCILNDAKSFREVVTKIGYSHNGGAGYNIVKLNLKKRNLIIPDYNFYGKSVGNIKEYESNTVFIENSAYSSGSGLKKKILKYELIEYKCAVCANPGIWNNHKLVLQLDHENGIHNDNRLSNLRFVCPNCHSQTHTYCGKNIKNGKHKYKRTRIEYLKNRNEISKNKAIPIIEKIKTSNIDFSKTGWVKLASVIIGIQYQKVNIWMKKHMLDFYNDECFKRK